MIFSKRCGRVKVFVVIFICIWRLEMMPSNSKILKQLLSCLSKTEHAHMLKYSNEEKTELEIKFTNKKNPIWTKKDISLFKAMDDLSPKPRKRTNYDEDCKGRFRANLIKLCSSGFLKYVGKRKEKPSVTIVTYKILSYPGDKPAKAKSNRKRKNQIEEMGNPGAFVNGNNCPSIDYSDNSMQEKDVVYTTYSNNIEEIENPGVSFYVNNCPSIDYSNIAMQGRDACTTYSNNCTKGFGDFEEKMIVCKNPVFSSAWGKNKRDNADMKIEEIENPSASFNGNNFPSMDYSNISMQERDVLYTADGNNIEEIENPGASFNGNNFPSMDYSNISMQGRDALYTTDGNNIEEIENPSASFNGNNCPSIDYSNIAMQGRDVCTTYSNNCTKGFGDFEEKMIVRKNPVLSSAWEKEERDNADIMKGSPGFLHSEDDWMEDGSLFCLMLE